MLGAADPLPEPPISREVDVRDFDGFVLNVERLMASELVAIRSLAEIGAAVLLWSRAWKQTPAASLPDDERVLSAFVRATPAQFRKLREGALHGFIKCSDGRLYHPVLAQEAAKTYARKQAFAKRRETDAERLRRWRETHRDTPPETRPGNDDETRFVRVVPVPVPVQDSDSSGLANAKPTESSAAADGAPDLKAAVFGPGLQWLSNASGKSSDRLRSLLGQWCRDHGDAAVMEALQAAQREKPLEPLAWITARFAAEQKRKAAASGYIPMHPGAGG